MKTHLLATLLSTLPPLGLWAAEPDNKGPVEVMAAIPARNRLEAAIRGLHSLRSHRHLPSGDPVVLAWMPEEEARAILKKAQDGFKQPRAILKVGTSVFDYPGLLALGTPTFSGDANGSYQLTLGIPPGWAWDHEQGTNPDEFRVDFDSKGRITQIAPVVYRH